MRIVDPAIEQYLSDLQRSRDPVLQEMEARASAESFPIIGPLVGRLCKQVACSIGARDVFEMGSGFGYSTHWFAQAVGEGGRVVHTDGSAKRSGEAKKYLERAGLVSRVTFEVGDSVAVLQQYPGPFDVVFIDIDKHGYPDALELARSRVRLGGYIITDNTLWSGRVVEPEAQRNDDTAGVIAYNREAFNAPDLLTTIVPLRDGVALSLKVHPDTKKKRT
jgi:predicted O-methyltransferase YrrM